MSADQLYIVTIENMVKFYVSTSKEPVTLKSQWNWQKKDANKDLLSSVKSLLEKVSNYEMAMAGAKWVVTQLPSGKQCFLQNLYFLYSFFVHFGSNWFVKF